MYQYDKYELEEELEMLEADLQSEEELLNYKRIELNNILQGVGYLQKRIAEIKETLAGNNYQQVAPKSGINLAEITIADPSSMSRIVTINGKQYAVSGEAREMIDNIESAHNSDAVMRFIYPERYKA